MAPDNRISIAITAEKKNAVETAVQALKTALQGVTLSLSEDERTSLPRIADKTLAFDAPSGGDETPQPGA